MTTPTPFNREDIEIEDLTGDDDDEVYAEPSTSIQQSPFRASLGSIPIRVSTARRQPLSIPLGPQARRFFDSEELEVAESSAAGALRMSDARPELLSQEYRGTQMEEDDEETSDVEIVDNMATIDEEARRGNLEARRRRLAARGIFEDDDQDMDIADDDDLGPRGQSVIVISDTEGDDAGPAPVVHATDDENDILGPVRRRTRARRTHQDEAGGGGPPNVNGNADRAYTPNGWEFPRPQLVPPPRRGTPQPRPQAFLGALNLPPPSGIFRPPPGPPPVAAPLPHAMHRRSLQMDQDRLPGRFRAHYDGLMRETQDEYNNIGLVNRLGDAVRGWGYALGDALGWGNNDDPGRDWGGFLQEVDILRPLIFGDGFDRGGRGNGGRTFFERWGGEGALPQREVTPPLNLPDAPEWDKSFTHPGKMPHGFTAEFAPVEPVLIVLDDSDDEETRRRRAKGKGKAPTNNADEEERDNTLVLVCVVCKDPLIMNTDKEEEKVYGLRCGHVMDGKCVWKLAKPYISDEEAAAALANGKGKQNGFAALSGLDENFQFTFRAPASSPPWPGNEATPEPAQQEEQPSNPPVYEEINDPTPAPVSTRTRSGAHSSNRRGVVPVPDPSHNRRRRGQGVSVANGLDGVESGNEAQQPDGGASVPQAARLDLSNPFLPTLIAPITTPLTSARQRGGRATGSGGARGRRARGTKQRKVPKTRGKLTEETLDWKCPVSGCGRSHLSVRLEMEGAPWKMDPDKGAVLMFL